VRGSRSLCVKHGLKKFYGLQKLTSEIQIEAAECNLDLISGEDNKLQIRLAEGVLVDLDTEYEMLCTHMLLQVVTSWKEKTTRMIAFSEPVDSPPHKRTKFGELVSMLGDLLVENSIQEEAPLVTIGYEPSALCIYYSFDKELNVLHNYDNMRVVSLDGVYSKEDYL